MTVIHSAAPPPVDAVTPHTPQLLVTSITAALVLTALVCSVMLWRRRGTPLYFLILLGGCVAVLNEPWLDLISQIYFPSNDAWTVFGAYGRTMPAWAVLSYTLYFGAQTMLTVELMRRGATRAQFWGVIAGVWVLNSLLEVTMLRTDIYFYFGEQPLRIGDFPAVWLVLNSLGVVVAAAVFLRAPAFFTGRATLLAVAVPPLGQLIALWVGTPHFLLLNSEQSLLAKTIASLVSIVVGLVAIDAVGRIACQGERVEASTFPRNGTPPAHSTELIGAR